MKVYVLACLCICALFFSKRVVAETHTTLGLSDKKNSIKADSMVSYYVDKAYNCLTEYKLEDAKSYLDSASSSIELITDQLILGYYYNYSGIYYSYKQNEVESHRMYYKAIECFEKTDQTTLLLFVFHNLAFSYIQKNDTKSLKNIIDKMYLIPQTEEEKDNLVNTYRIITFYYKCLYEKNKANTAYLDSAIYYDSQVISIYENTQHLSLQKKEIAYNYLSLASNLLEKYPVEMNRIEAYLKKSEELMNKNDSTMIVNQYWVRGKIAYEQQNFDEAEQFFSAQLAIMDDWIDGEALSMYAELFGMMAKVSEAQQKYVTALDYERMRIDYLTRIHDAQKYEIIRELETKYEVQRKEQEIIQLTELNDYRKKANYLYMGLIILGFGFSLFFFHWIRQKKKATEAQLELSRLEKRDAMMQIRLREEKLKKTELEKYEALLENHFKGEQISEMDEELKELRKEQDQLNLLIATYADKVKEYEVRRSQQIVFATSQTYYTSLTRDIYDLSTKRLANNKELKEYTGKLLNMQDSFFDTLNTKSSESLSALNIKYCICFYIDMKIEHIAECFSVEPRSVHIARHRLKSKFNISKEQDVNTFLKQMTC